MQAYLIGREPLKILVTGGTVFVSRSVAEYFIKKGHDVYVLNRNTRPQPHGAKLIKCDRRNIGDKLKDLTFDTVIDITAYTAEDINLLLDGLSNFKDYIMISSSAVYPETLAQPFKETDKTGENKFWGSYGTNKTNAERALLNRVPNAYILRPPYLYGEYNNVYREAFVFDCADFDLPFYLPTDGQLPLQFLHVEDLCRFIEILLIKHPKQKIFNVGNRETVTIKDWVELCYAATGKSPEFKNVSADIEQRNYFPFYNYSYRLDVNAQCALLPDLLSLESGLKRSYDWYKNNKQEVRKKNYLQFIENNLS